MTNSAGDTGGTGSGEWIFTDFELGCTALAFNRIEVAAASAAVAFNRLSAACAAAFPSHWYNRLRWRLDSLTRRYLPAVSSTRAMRRLRVWVERTVDELEST